MKLLSVGFTLVKGWLPIRKLTGLGYSRYVSSVRGIKFCVCTEHGLKVSDFTDKKQKTSFSFRAVDT